MDGLSLYVCLPLSWLASHFFVQVAMLVLNIFWLSSARRTMSKELLKSIVARIALQAGLGTFKPSSTHSVTAVRSSMVECRSLKPCYASNRGMCGVIVLRTSFSRILIRLHNKEIGLYDEGSVGTTLV